MLAHLAARYHDDRCHSLCVGSVHIVRGFSPMYTVSCRKGSQTRFFDVVMNSEYVNQYITFA
jgi:hypothetical protein